MIVELEEAQTKLAQLVRRAVGGEEVILVQDDESRVKLVPVEQPPTQPVKRPEYGHWKGKLPPMDLERFRPLTDDELREEGFGLCIPDDK